MKFRKIMWAAFFTVTLAAISQRNSAAETKGNGISDAQALAAFTAAGLAYQAEDYDKAIGAYEDILRGGKESGAVYYNLGNSYFKRGNSGKAILNYERARRLIPRDGDLIFNLEYARARLNANLPEAAAAPWGELVERGIRNWTDRELAWALCCLALVLAATHLTSLYGQWPPLRRRRVIGALCVFLLLCAGGLAAKRAAETGRAAAVIAGDAKFEPRADATTYFSLEEGTLLNVIRTENDWAKIRRSDGKTGWVPQKILERL